MTFFVCKMCGRSMKAEEKPDFCYFDRSDTIENISDEDAVKMGLFSQIGKRLVADGIEYEFPGDIKWHPFTGQPMEERGFTLTEFQDAIMVGVRGVPEKSDYDDLTPGMRKIRESFDEPSG